MYVVASSFNLTEIVLWLFLSDYEINRTLYNKLLYCYDVSYTLHVTMRVWLQGGFGAPVTGKLYLYWC